MSHTRITRTSRTCSSRSTRGFTLIEILVVIGMLAILATVVLVAVNPLRQFAQARNSQRQSNVAAILNAIDERIADNGGVFVSSSSIVTNPGCRIIMPPTLHNITKAQLDMRNCLVPTYLSELPYDPANGNNTCTTPECNGPGESYDTEYTVSQDVATNRVTVCAPASAEPAIASSTPFCITR
jgi:prepilin-type N-terminal cleavage/methylation domain-containing protein